MVAVPVTLRTILLLGSPGRSHTWFRGYRAQFACDEHSSIGAYDRR